MTWFISKPVSAVKSDTPQTARFAMRVAVVVGREGD